MSRTKLALLGLGVLIVLAGCSGAGSTVNETEQTPDASVAEEQEMNLDTDTFAVMVQGDPYRCVAYQDKSLVTGNGAVGYGGLSCERASSLDAVNATQDAPDDITFVRTTFEGTEHVCLVSKSKSIVSGNGATGFGGVSCSPLETNTSTTTTTTQ